MLIGPILALTWVALLVRYPGRALPISASAIFALMTVGAWVVWQEHQQTERLARLELRLEYLPAECPADRPLKVALRNTNDLPLKSLQWRVAAYAKGDDLNLARREFDAPRYQGPGDLQPGSDWQSCLPLPSLRPGYRPASLSFRAERLLGEFAD